MTDVSLDASVGLGARDSEKTMRWIAVLILACLGGLTACAPTASAPVPIRATATTAPAAAALPASAPASAAPAAASRPPTTTVRIAVAPGAISNAGRFVAVERGYFQEEGIELEEVHFDTSAKMLPALAAGQIEAAIGGINAGLFNAIAQGIPVRIVLDSTVAPPGDSAGGLILRKDLADSGAVRDLADLRGRKVAITSKGQSTELVLHAGLQQVGLSIEDVETVELGYPEMTLALGNRNIDAAISIEPFGTLAVAQGHAVRLRDWGDMIPNDHMAIVMYSAAFADSQADAARRYAKAYVRGVREYEAARKQGQDREAIIAILMKHSALKDRALYDQLRWIPLDPDGRVNGATFAMAQDWFAERGYIRTKVDLSQVVDQRFADYAVAQLGPAAR